MMNKNMPWKSFFAFPKNKLNLFLVSITLILMVVFTRYFLLWNEDRHGISIYDPFINTTVPIDFSIILFLLTNVTVFLGFLRQLKLPYTTIQYLIGVIFILLMRLILIFLFPLYAPDNIIPLRDLFLESTIYADKPMTRDLFFSGHTANLCLLFFIEKNRWLKVLFGVITLVVGILLIWQHVHYTIDVMFAPILTFVCYKIAKSMTNGYWRKIQ